MPSPSNLLDTLPMHPKDPTSAPSRLVFNPLTLLVPPETLAAHSDPSNPSAPSTRPNTNPRETTKDWHISEGFGLTCTPTMRSVLQQIADHQGRSLAAIVRKAVVNFIDKPISRAPHLDATEPMPRRTTTITFTISERKFPNTRKSLDAYARSKKLDKSAVMRRAAYEFIKACEANTDTDDTDHNQPTTDTQSQPKPTLQSQPKPTLQQLIKGLPKGTMKELLMDAYGW